MATNEKTITELVACTNPQATDVFILSSNVAGNTLSLKVTSNDMFNNTSVNLTTNVATANIMVITGNTTPANNTDIPTGAANGAIWSDGSYVYVNVSGEIKRVALSTF